MFFLYFLNYLQTGEIKYNASTVSSFDNQESCQNLQIFINSNITYSCENQFNFTIQHDYAPTFVILVEDSINVINNSNINYNDIKIRDFIKTNDDTQFIFTEFMDISIIDYFINLFSVSYENVFITMEWNRYKSDNVSYCQWDHSSILSLYDGIINYYETLSKETRWKKLCMNGQAYLHYIEKPQDEIIIIPLKTLGVSVGSIVGVILIIAISMYILVVWKIKCKPKKDKSSAENTDDQNSNDSIENIKDQNAEDTENIKNVDNEQNTDNLHNNDEINEEKQTTNNEDHKNDDDAVNNEINDEKVINVGTEINDIIHNINDENIEALENSENNKDKNNEDGNMVNNEEENVINKNDNISKNNDETLSDHNINESQLSNSNSTQKSNENDNNNVNNEITYKKIFICFIKELFDIGNSTGSLISEAIGLLRLIQRLSATRTFTLHFSKDCLKMFSWAINTFDVILSNIYLRNFEDIEIFYFIVYVIPFAMIIFLSSLYTSILYFSILLICAALGTLGFGFAYVKYNKKIATAFILPSLGIIIIIVILLICKVPIYNAFMYGYAMMTFPFTIAIFITLVLLCVMLIPFFIHNLYFLGTYCFIGLIICIISFIIELIVKKYEYFSIEDIIKSGAEKIAILFTNFFSLLFVPSTEYLISLMNGKYHNNPNCIFGFIMIILVPSILITLILLVAKDSDVINRYRKDYFYFELIDLLRQIAYAFSSAFDEPWACLFFELLWVLLFSIFHPYKCVSEYVLQGGNSGIVIIANIISLVFHYNDNIYLSFYGSLSIVCIACLPAIASLFVFFIIDFSIDDTDDEDSSFDKDFQSPEVMSGVFPMMNPLVIFFYGIIIPILLEHFNEVYSHYHKISS